MNASKLFRKAVEYHLQKGYTQVYVSKELGIQPQQFNSFLKGRRNFSEERKEEISKIFGKSYLDMLNVGHQIIQGSKPKSQKIKISVTNIVPKLKKLDPEDLKFIDELATRLIKNSNPTTP